MSEPPHDDMNPPRHLLDIESLDPGAIEWLLQRSRALAEGARPAALDATVANLFYEPSTRTRVSFEQAARRLGMAVINLALDKSSATKGESLADTAATLAAMGIDALVLRHPESGQVASLAGSLALPLVLVNAGDGCAAHPSQALLDAATLNAHGIDWPKARIAILGDIRHSRVARSDIALFDRLGAAEIRIAGPEELLPDVSESLPVVRCQDLETAVDGANVIVCLRIQRERMAATGWPDPEAFNAAWGLTGARLEPAAADVQVLHPGPINRGVEIAGEVADGPRSRILDQVRMGVFTRMAVFEWLFNRL